jgi:hypothetical protein
MSNTSFAGTCHVDIKWLAVAQQLKGSGQGTNGQIWMYHCTDKGGGGMSRRSGILRVSVYVCVCEGPYPDLDIGPETCKGSQYHHVCEYHCNREKIMGEALHKMWASSSSHFSYLSVCKCANLWVGRHTAGAMVERENGKVTQCRKYGIMGKQARQAQKYRAPFHGFQMLPVPYDGTETRALAIDERLHFW